jgi:hypothetical protein
MLNKKSVCLNGTILLAITHIAAADLAIIGPVDLITAFPNMIQDANNIQLGSCNLLNPINEGGTIVNNVPCAGVELSDPLGDFIQGNILEFTYYRAESNIVNGTPAGERFRLRMEVQGGVFPPESINNAVRVRLRNLVQQGTYQVSTPLGDASFVVGPAEIAHGVDEELPGGVLAAAPAFDAARAGSLSCFWSNGTQMTLGADSFYGDGLTESPLIPVTGVPSCTQTAVDLDFAVQFPDGTVVSSNLFTVEGKQLPQLGIVVDRATYERNPSGNVTRVDIWVTSTPGQAISVTGSNVTMTPSLMAEQMPGTGKYYLRQRLTGTIPANIMVDIGGTSTTVIDEVKVTRALDNVNTDTLNVRAVSSDRFSAPPLTAYDQDGNVLGTLVNGELDVITPVLPNIPPREVRVNSNAGGFDIEPVDIGGGNIVFQ